MAAVNKHSNPMLGWIVGIALETGMRSAEISTLRRSMVDLERRIVKLVDTKTTLREILQKHGLETSMKLGTRSEDYAPSEVSPLNHSSQVAFVDCGSAVLTA